mgnify:CR=1 FL=1
MYSPTHYQENRPDLIFEAIRRYSFATVISMGKEGPFVSHLPLLLENDGSAPALVGHCARANPQWRHFSEGQEITAIFHGPHAYISPAWYQPQADNVPTWNYVAIHAKGTAQIIESSDQTFQILRTIVRHFESSYGTNWDLPDPSNVELDALVKAIVGFRIDIKDIQAKFKLSQKQPAADRSKVIEELPKVAGSEGSALVEYMRLVGI